jgi:type III pantothenate kinase
VRVLAVDIGNSSIKFGFYENEHLQNKFTVDTGTVDPRLISDHALDRVDAAVISSVVPELENGVSQSIEGAVGVKPEILRNDWDFGLTIKHQALESIGTDRLVNAYSAANFHQVPCIVCSFGTATTIDLVDKDWNLVGGLIAPGFGMGAKALHERTSRLPLVQVDPDVAILNQTTGTAIQAGLLYSQIGLLETSTARIWKEFGSAMVVATGGFASLVAAAGGPIDVVDEDLQLNGINRVFIGRQKSLK